MKILNLVEVFKEKKKYIYIYIYIKSLIYRLLLDVVLY